MFPDVIFHHMTQFVKDELRLFVYHRKSLRIHTLRWFLFRQIVQGKHGAAEGENCFIAVIEIIIRMRRGDGHLPGLERCGLKQFPFLIIPIQADGFHRGPSHAVHLMIHFVNKQYVPQKIAAVSRL